MSRTSVLARLGHVRLSGAGATSGSSIIITALLTCALSLPYVGGFPLAYLLSVVTLCMLVWTVSTRRALVISNEPALYLFAAAFGLLAVAFVVTARAASDLAYIVNFLILGLVPLIAAALSHHAQRDRMLLVADGALVGTALAAVVALLQILFGGYRRAEGFGSDPIWSSSAAMILGYIALVGYTQTSGWRKYLYPLGPLLGLATVLLSASRGPLVAGIVLLPVAVFMVIKFNWRTLFAGTAVALAMLGGIAVVWPFGLHRLQQLPQTAFELLTTGDMQARMTSVRIAYWRASVTAFLDHPWFGVGWGHRMEAISPYIDPHLVSYTKYRHQHADILGFGVSGGLVGLISYVGLIIAPLTAAFFSPRDSQYQARLYACAVLSVGYFVCGISNLLFGFEFHTTLYACLSGIILGYCRDPSPPRPQAT